MIGGEGAGFERNGVGVASGRGRARNGVGEGLEPRIWASLGWDWG